MYTHLNINFSEIQFFFSLDLKLQNFMLIIMISPLIKLQCEQQDIICGQTRHSDNNSTKKTYPRKHLFGFKSTHVH